VRWRHLSRKERRPPVITGPGTTPVDLHAIFNACSAKALASAVMAAFVAATAAKAGFESRAALPDINTTKSCDFLRAATRQLKLTYTVADKTRERRCDAMNRPRCIPNESFSVYDRWHSQRSDSPRQVLLEVILIHNIFRRSHVQIS
jgi:hypothetical protein